MDWGFSGVFLDWFMMGLFIIAWRGLTCIG